MGLLSLAATLVGGLAVGNGLLVLIGSLASGREQRRADAIITKVLGAKQFEVLAVFVLQYGLLALFAAILATGLGIALASVLTSMLLFGDAANPSNGFYEAFGAERLHGETGEFHGAYGWPDLRTLVAQCRG